MVGIQEGKSRVKFRILGIIGLIVALNGAVGSIVLLFVYGANAAEWPIPFISNGAQVAAGAALAWWGLKRWHGPLQANWGGTSDGNLSLAEVTKDGEKPKLGPIALVFSIIGILIMLFSGGCILFGLSEEMGNSAGGGFKIGIGGVLLFGGIPFVLGLITWLLATASWKPKVENDGEF